MATVSTVHADDASTAKDAASTAKDAARPAATANVRMPAAQRTAEVKRLQRELDSAAPEAIESALVRAVELGGADVAKLVAARAQKGLPPQLTLTAVQTLAALKQPSTAPVLLELALHRRAEVRAQVVVALTEVRSVKGQAVLLAALDDPSPDVRKVAAEALGTVGGRHALAALISAMERGVDGAARAVGKLADARDATKLIELASTHGLTVLEPALTEWIAHKRVPLAHKVRLVEGLRAAELKGLDACLTRLHDGLDESSDTALRAALKSEQGREPRPARVALSEKKAEKEAAR
jgi:hypothetical protein